MRTPKNSSKVLELEEYSIWVRINRLLAGPILTFTSLYILSFVILTFIILFSGIEMTGLQQTWYYFGFVLLLFSVLFAFVGALLRKST